MYDGDNLYLRGCNDVVRIMNALQIWMASLFVIAGCLIVVFIVTHGDMEDTTGALYFLGGLFTVANIVQQYVIS